MQSKFDGLDAIVTVLRGDHRLLGVDVGARGRLPPDWAPLEGRAEFICFDADPQASEALREFYLSRGCGDSIRVVTAALAARNETRTLYLTHQRSGSSLYRPDTAQVREYVDSDYLLPIETVEVETRNASEVLEELGEANLDFLKLDIQGAELEVLRCMGPEILDHVVCIETEVSMQDRQNGTPVFREMDEFLASNGFALYDASPVRVHRTLEGSRSNYLAGELGVNSHPTSVSARIWEMDVLYVRPPEQAVSLGHRKARNLVVAFCLYGFFTEALHAIDLMAAELDLPDSESSRMREAVKSWHRAARFGLLSGRSVWARMVRWLLKYFDLRPSPPHWPHS